MCDEEEIWKKIQKTLSSIPWRMAYQPNIWPFEEVWFGV